MGLETGSTIASFITSNPTSSDPVNQGDDHLRLIKSVLQAQFPGVGGLGYATAITTTEAELNSLHTGSITAILPTISGYVVGANTAIASTDTLLGAIGKAQGQINTKGTVSSVIASTAVVNGLSLSGGSITSAGTIALTGSVVLGASPSFTGIPTAPTAATGTNTTQIATTAFALGASIGTGQSWSTPARSSGVTYTNSTGKPIMVCISIRYGATSAQNSYIYVDSINIQTSGGNNVSGAFSVPVHTFIVSNGATYSASIGGSLQIWSELS